MAVADLGACEWFVMELRRSGLVERSQLEQIVGEFLKKSPRTEAKALADYLTEQKVLSRFQADRVLQGKAGGLVLGPYTLQDTIGSGSMGTVYRAQSRNDNHYYAVKVLPRRSMWNVRLARRQVRSFSQFNHPSVVPFVDVGTAGGLHYLAWPLVEGEPMEARVQRAGKLPADVAALFALQIAHGLSLAHQNGLFHGLLKPSNILISSSHTAQVLDFGIGSLLVENEGESLVDTMSTANTLTSGLDCSSPECILDPTARTPAGDQYSLGCMLYFALTGRYPFPEGSAVEKMMAHQSKEPTPIQELSPEVPEKLIAIVTKLMKKQADQRFGLMEEVVDALQPLAAEPSHAQQNTPANTAMLTETPRPNLTTINPRPTMQPPRPASRPANRPAPAAPANLPAGVRLSQRPLAEQAAKEKAQDAENAAKPPMQFGSLTLVLTGMALVCLLYLSLTYFQVIR